MITRGIIEKSIDEYKVKVRVPSIDRMSTSSLHTSTENLNTAIFATLPGCQVHLQPGDVVIVYIDDSGESAIILGYLYRVESVEKTCSYKADSLIVTDSATLSRNTTIGEVKASEISYLSGLTENIQKQLDELSRRLNVLEER